MIQFERLVVVVFPQELKMYLSITMLVLLTLMRCNSMDSKFKYHKAIESALYKVPSRKQSDNIFLSPLSFYVSHTFLLAGTGSFTWDELALSMTLIYHRSMMSEQEMITSEFANVTKTHLAKSHSKK